LNLVDDRGFAEEDDHGVPFLDEHPCRLPVG